MLKDKTIPTIYIAQLILQKPTLFFTLVVIINIARLVGDYYI